MSRWPWFSLGIVTGLVMAVGFGFAGAKHVAEKPASSFVPGHPITAAVGGEKDTKSVPPTEDGKLRIIEFGAHPDDCEIRAGGAAILWTQQGHHVKFVSATNGDIGHWSMAGGPLAVRRYAEVQQAAKIFGTTTDV